jgi:Family of unknown function (DUF6338)
VPTNLVALVLFILLLAPGLISITWRQFRPIRRPTVLGELAGLVFRSLVCDALALGVFAVIHLIQPQWTPDVGGLIRTPGAYFRQNYALVAWWALGLLLLACAFAYIGAQVWANLTTRTERFFKIFEKLVPGEVAAYQPAWWEIFTAYPRSRRWVQCVLDDGTYIAGDLHSFNPDPNETDDRELSLQGKIVVRNRGDDRAVLLGGDKGVGAVILSARKIQYMSVSYIKRPPKAKKSKGQRSFLRFFYN